MVCEKPYLVMWGTILDHVIREYHLWRHLYITFEVCLLSLSNIPDHFKFKEIFCVFHPWLLRLPECTSFCFVPPLKPTQVLYAPNNTDTDRIIHKANESFALVHHVSQYARKWLNVSAQIRDYLDQNSTERNLHDIRQVSQHTTLWLIYPVSNKH